MMWAGGLVVVVAGKKPLSRVWPEPKQHVAAAYRESASATTSLSMDSYVTAEY